MSLIKKNIVEWVKSRSDAIKSIMKYWIMGDLWFWFVKKSFHFRLFKLVEVESDLELLGINNDLLLKVYNCFFNGLNDYTTDSKGDSGSKYNLMIWCYSLFHILDYLRVREGSIEALESFTLFCSKYSARLAIF